MKGKVRCQQLVKGENGHWSLLIRTCPRPINRRVMAAGTFQHHSGSAPGLAAEAGGTTVALVTGDRWWCRLPMAVRAWSSSQHSARSEDSGRWCGGTGVKKGGDNGAGWVALGTKWEGGEKERRRRQQRETMLGPPTWKTGRSGGRARGGKSQGNDAHVTCDCGGLNAARKPISWLWRRSVCTLSRIKGPFVERALISKGGDSIFFSNWMRENEARGLLEWERRGL